MQKGRSALFLAIVYPYYTGKCRKKQSAIIGQLLRPRSGVQHLLHLKSKSKILRPIEIMGFFYEFFCQIQGNNLL